jgi:hypothetical protein
VISWSDFQEFLFDANAALMGVAIFYWSKPMARAINRWAVRCYERFPKLKSLPGSQNAGTEWNYKTTYIFLRIVGAFVFSSAVGFVILFLRILRK